MSLLPQDFLKSLSDRLRAQNKLQEIIDLFRDKLNLKIMVGAELEFYLSSNINPKEFSELLKMKIDFLHKSKMVEGFLGEMKTSTAAYMDICEERRQISTTKSPTRLIYAGSLIKKEKGNNQFEIDLPPSSNVNDYPNTINKTKEGILETAALLGGKAYLSPKVFKNDYGNSMHIHISFDKTTEGLLDTAAKSLCHFMLKTCLVFMPTEEDYLRLDEKFMAPTHVSFGNNNRSVAVRMPDLTPKRLEHRVPSLASDPYLVLFTILKSILIGLTSNNKIEDIPKIYGNAYDSQYSLKTLPKSIEEALANFDITFFDKVLLF